MVHVALVPLQLPAQAPVPPHAGWPGRGAPLTKPHMPVVPLQNSQAPLHALLQQTPSAQKPLKHCEPNVQVCPGLFLQAPVASQLLALLQVSGSSALVTATHAPPPPVHA